MIAIVTGLPGASKSYMTAQKIVELVGNSRKWFRQSGTIRTVRSNLELNKEFTCSYFGTPDTLKSFLSDIPILRPSLVKIKQSDDVP